MHIRLNSIIIVFVCFYLFAADRSFAQPVWSPAVRSEREMQWMKDSLHLTKLQVEKITPISLDYQRNMDKAAQPDYATRGKRQHPLMRQKDAEMKAILTKKQFDKYYRRELLIRQSENDKHYEGDRQPY